MQEIKARVVSQERNLYRIKSEKGEIFAEVSGKFRYDAGTVSDFPAVGDYVLASWPDDQSHGVITALYPRKNCFLRKAAGTERREQVVAANVNYVFLCMSLNNDYNLRRLERYLSIAWESGSSPVIILTKADLCADVETKVREVSQIAIGVDVIPVSSYLDDFDKVYDYVRPGMTVAFLGSSGVGKSTLINKLVGEELIETQGLRNDDKGRHTTTHREVIELKNGAFVIDTPGMRELGMWDSGAGIETTFSDIEELTCDCRFGDCSHTREPGCAIRAALESGELDAERWNAYLKLKKENLVSAAGSSYLDAKKQKFKEISKMNKHNKKK
ncbi:MAG: ribosome small subunit-dependent GTPase A [Lachnospiraceae bacterium]|nr:ribosome small subunit-dependent GTPase A [Lachnospiraceae bacterium]